METVELHRDAAGSLGISITGGANSPLGDLPIMIADLNPSGPAALSGRLQVPTLYQLLYNLIHNIYIVASVSHLSWLMLTEEITEMVTTFSDIPGYKLESCDVEVILKYKFNM